jgi:hypothetical protein
VTRKRMPSQREQYGSTVHLFIGTGRSPCKITSMPFAYDNNSIVIYLGLDSLFLFKSVSSFLPSCRSSLAHSFGSAPSFVLFPCSFIPWALVRRSLSTHYTPEALLNHVFEDLRKPKAPNTSAPDDRVLPSTDDTNLVPTDALRVVPIGDPSSSHQLTSHDLGVPSFFSNLQVTWFLLI